jgi:hypothetical protein
MLDYNTGHLTQIVCSGPSLASTGEGIILLVATYISIPYCKRGKNKQTLLTFLFARSILIYLYKNLTVK